MITGKIVQINHLPERFNNENNNIRLLRLLVQQTIADAIVFC